MSDRGQRHAKASLPPDLTVRGAEHILRAPAVGVSGARRATRANLEAAQRVGERIAKLGFALASGDARGVDEQAERGALLAGGAVILVPVEGLDRWSPRSSNGHLLTEANHVAVNEYPADATWTVQRAHQRNRLIIRLSVALVVVEAGTRGGSWEAGLACLQLERPLLVLRPARQRSAGNERLIERGGFPVERMSDLDSAIIEAAARASRRPEGTAGAVDLNG